MFDYRMVMSIHEQKMQEYRAEAERHRARRLSRRTFRSIFDLVAARLRYLNGEPVERPATVRFA